MFALNGPRLGAGSSPKFVSPEEHEVARSCELQEFPSCTFESYVNLGHCLAQTSIPLPGNRC